MEIVENGQEVVVTAARGVVTLTATPHDLVVHGARRIRFGPTRAGVRSFVRVARDILHLSPSDMPDLELAAINAMRRAALNARGSSVHDVERAVSREGLTPLIFSERFHRAAHLEADALRFRPCRIAIAKIEEITEDDHRPEAAARLVERLEQWQTLYSSDGEPRRAVTKTLAEYGDVASADALWGLRNVKLKSRLPTQLHLEIVGGLGAHPSALLLTPAIRIVERAPIAELNAVRESVTALLGTALPLGMAPEHALVELIGLVEDVDDEVPDSFFGVRGLVDAGIALFERRAPLSTEIAQPPLPAPVVAGIRMLQTLGDFLDESSAMRHCVSIRRFAALRGDAFVFHVEHEGEQATVQLDRDGKIVEARGPNNVNNEAARWGAEILKPWGQLFPLYKWGSSKKIWRLQSLPPQGMAPLAFVEDCVPVYVRARDRCGDADGQLASWFAAHIERALRGEIGLVVDANDPAPRLVIAVDRHGERVGALPGVEDHR